MIPSVTTRTALVGQAPLAAARPSSSAPPTAPPPPALDFSTIDSTQKVLFLPTMIVGREALGTAIERASTEGMKFSASMLMQIGQSVTQKVAYSLAAGPAVGVLGNGGLGAEGASNFSETWTFNPSDRSWTTHGNIGPTEENLVRTEQKDGVHTDGRIGAMDFHTIYAPATDGKSFVWTGTIGNQPFKQTLVLNLDDDNNYILQVDGSLGSDTLSYAQTATRTERGIKLEGEGTIAGQPVKLRQDFEYARPPAGSAPTPV